MAKNSIDPKLLKYLKDKGLLIQNIDNGLIKKSEPKIRQALLNLAGSWEHNKPQLMKDVPLVDYAIGPTLDYLAGKGGEENALAILPMPGKISSSEIKKLTKEGTENFYRRLTEGQMNKIIREKGKVTPTKNEKSLTVTKSFPRKGDYVLQLPSEKQLVENELKTSFEKPRASQTYQYPGNVDLLSGDYNLFKRINNQLIKVDPKLYGAANKEALIDRQVVNSMSPASKGNKSGIPLGSETRLDKYNIYSNPINTPLSLNTDYLYGIEQYGTGKYKSYPTISNNFGNKSFRSTWNEKGKFYSDIEPSSNELSNTANNILKYIETSPKKIKEEFRSPVMINSARSYYMTHFGEDISMLSDEDISKFLQKSYEDAKSQGILYHSTNYPISEIDPSKIGTQTNKGWFGEGLYFSDSPSQEYGLLQEPFIHRGIEKKVLINNYADPINPTIRFTSPQKEVDEILSKVSKPITKVNKSGQFSVTGNSSPFGLGETGNMWNDFIRKNNIDAIYSKSSTKGTGINFPEIAITPNSKASLKSLYAHPELLEEAGRSGILNRDWNLKDINRVVVPIGLGLGAYNLNENNSDMNEYKSGGWIKNAVNPAHRGFCSPMTKSTCTPRRKAFAMTMKKHHGFHADGGYINNVTNEDYSNLMFLGGKTHDETNANMIGGAAQLGIGFATGNPAAIATGGAGFLANNIKNVGTVLKDKDSTLLEKGLSIVSPLAGGIFANSIRDKESNWNETNDAIKERNKMFNIKAKGGVILPLGVQPNMAMNYDDGGKLLTEFNNGGRHETNIYGGVPQGSDSQGSPNLVEEGETKFNDYIFSDRLILDKATVAEHNLPKSMEGKTFAEASKKLNKLYKERPNDFITKSTAKDYLTRLTAANDKARAIDESSNTMAYGGNMYAGGSTLNLKRTPNQITLGSSSDIIDKTFTPGLFFDPVKDKDQLIKSGSNLFAGSNGDGSIVEKPNFSTNARNLRYAPIAFDVLASTGLLGKNPTPKTVSPTLVQNQGMLYPQAIDEMQTRKAIDEAYQTGVSGLAESAGGSGSALRAGLSGLTSDYMSGIGKSFADVNRANIAQKQAADQFNLQTQGNLAAQNAQLMNQANIYNNQLMNAKSQADYENRLSYLGKAAEGVGDIGYESRLGEILPKIYGYDQYGNYTAPLGKKACGGRLRLKSYKK